MDLLLCMWIISLCSSFQDHQYDYWQDYGDHIVRLVTWMEIQQMNDVSKMQKNRESSNNTTIASCIKWYVKYSWLKISQQRPETFLCVSDCFLLDV